MSAIKVVPNPRPRIWLDPLPRYRWEYHRRGRRWYGDYGPHGLTHAVDWSARSEKAIRRKLARLIRASRKEDWERYMSHRSPDRRGDARDNA